MRLDSSGLPFVDNIALALPSWWAIPTAEGNMRRINVQQFHQLGRAMQGLTSAADAVLTEDQLTREFARNSLLFARIWLILLAADEIVPLAVSKSVARSLLTTVDNLLQSLNNPTEETAIREYQGRLRRNLVEFEAVLAAELATLDIYFVSQKGAYATPDLIDRAENLLPESIRAVLAPEIVRDIQQAGRCLAFDVPTATAFHILRATERVIWLYHQKLLGQLPPVKLRNWGAYIRCLKAGGADEAITGALTHIKDVHRNPVFHPEQFSTSEDAFVLVGVSISAITMMVQALGD